MLELVRRGLLARPELTRVSPVMSRKVRVNVPRLDQPVSKAISVMESSVSRSSAVAFSMRRVSR